MLIDIVATTCSSGVVRSYVSRSMTLRLIFSTVDSERSYHDRPY